MVAEKNSFTNRYLCTYMYPTVSLCNFFLTFYLDFRPPTLSCPGPTLTADNDKGKNVATVNWMFDFDDNSLVANEPGITKNDSFTVVLTIGGNNVDTKLPKLIGIGTNSVKYSVTDAAHNTANCSFTVTVRGKSTV